MILDLGEAPRSNRGRILWSVHHPSHLDGLSIVLFCETNSPSKSMASSPSAQTFEEQRVRFEAARTLGSIEELIWHSNIRNEVCDTLS